MEGSIPAMDTQASCFTSWLAIAPHHVRRVCEADRSVEGDRIRSRMKDPTDARSTTHHQLREELASDAASAMVRIDHHGAHVRIRDAVRDGTRKADETAPIARQPRA